MLSDAAALLLAGLIAFLLWASPVRHQPLDVYLPAAPILLLIVFGYAQAGLYPGFGLGPVETIRRYWLVTITAFVALAALVFALKVPNQYSRVTLTLAMVLTLGLVPLGRWLVRRLARRLDWWKEPVVLVGSGARTERARQLFEEPAGWEYRPVGVLVEPGMERDVGGLPVLGGLDDAEEIAAAGVQVAFADVDGLGAEQALDQLRLVFPKVIILRDVQELPVEGVQVRNLGGVLGLEYGSNLLRPQARWVKRTLDILLGTTGLVLALPIMLPAMLAVRILSPGPVLFWQSREGFRGRTIRVPKIRTMVPDAEETMEQLLQADPSLRAQWETNFKLEDDPRLIPGVGRFFRRWSIDELPQLWSVVRGEMSLVGPRPFPAYHLQALAPEARRLRSRVRPGLTGLWQVTARGRAGVEEQQYHDVYYIRNWSLWLDIYVLAHTVSAVLTGRGAY